VANAREVGGSADGRICLRPRSYGLRHHLDVALRTALLRRGTTAAVLRYNAVHPYDVEVLERAHGVASADDPLVPALTARLAVATAG
jgi:hypothetical protein